MLISLINITKNTIIRKIEITVPIHVENYCFFLNEKLILVANKSIFLVYFKSF